MWAAVHSLLQAVWITFKGVQMCGIRFTEVQSAEVTEQHLTSRRSFFKD